MTSVQEKYEHNIQEAAKRAKAEAQARKEVEKKQQFVALPKEINGRDGLEPTRFGDWEKGGIASDF